MCCMHPGKCRLLTGIFRSNLLCRIQEEGGLLTNSEVIQVLKDREADKQAVVSKALPSEIKVGHG